METLHKLYQHVLDTLNWETVLFTLVRILILLVVFKAASKLLLQILHRAEKKLIKKEVAEGQPPSETQKRIETIMRLVRKAVLITLWLLVVLVVLKEIGFEIGPILASAGVIGVALGFGAQNLVRDIIAGFFIILENQIRVNDVAVVNGTGGLVEKIRFRTTVLRDLGGVVHSFPKAPSTASAISPTNGPHIFLISVWPTKRTPTM